MYNIHVNRNEVTNVNNHRTLTESDMNMSAVELFKREAYAVAKSILSEKLGRIITTEEFKINHWDMPLYYVTGKERGDAICSADCEIDNDGYEYSVWWTIEGRKGDYHISEPEVLVSYDYEIIKKL